MRIRFVAAAKRELLRVHGYYEGKAEGLGDAFLDDVAASLSLIKQHPRAWTSMGGAYYRRSLRKFRYGLVYRADSDAIVVLGVGHLSRRPAFKRKLMAGREK